MHRGVLEKKVFFDIVIFFNVESWSYCQIAWKIPVKSLHLRRSKKWIFQKYFSKILIKFHNNFSEHHLVDACLCLFIYSILLLRYWLSSIFFSQFVFYFQVLQGVFLLRRHGMGLFEKPINCFLCCLQVWTLGRLPPILIDFLGELPYSENWRITKN